MKTFFMLLIMSANLLAHTAINKDGAYKLNRMSKLARDLSLGTQVSGGQWLKGTWTRSASDVANGNPVLLDDEGLPVKLPAGAIIYDCVINVATQPTGATSSLKIALSSNAAEDLKASALAHTTWTTSSRIACLPTGSAASSIKMGSEGPLRIKFGSEPPSAGKIQVWVNYVIAE